MRFLRLILFGLVWGFGPYAHGATGDELWRYTSEYEVKEIFIDNKGENMYFESGNAIAAIDSHTGQEKWRTKPIYILVAAGSRLLAADGRGSWFIFDPQTGNRTEIQVLRRNWGVHVLASDDMFYFIPASGNVLALDIHEKMIWKYELTTDFPRIRQTGRSSPVEAGVTQNTLFATVLARVSDKEGYAIAIALERETGKLRWYKAERRVVSQVYNHWSISQTKSQKALVIHGTMDPPELTGLYYRITSWDEDSGGELWTKIFHPNTFTTVDNTIYVFEHPPRSMLHALDRNGTELWAEKTEGVSFVDHLLGHEGTDRFPRNHEDALVGHQLQNDPKKIVSIQLDSGERCDAQIPGAISAPNTRVYLDSYVARNQKIYVAIRGNDGKWLWILNSQNCQTILVKKIMPFHVSPLYIHVMTDKIIVPGEKGGLVALEP